MGWDGLGLGWAWVGNGLGIQGAEGVGTGVDQCGLMSVRRLAPNCLDVLILAT